MKKQPASQEESLWKTSAQDIENLARALCQQLDQLPLDEKVQALNLVRRLLHDHSPFQGEPVDLVEWVPAESVIANEYNPNHVASPEMELLYLSIKEDGYTQPIVTYPESEYHLVVDGFHRNRVGKEHRDITAKIHGYLPVVGINTSLDRRMASTIRHNRARGKHQVGSMADLVIVLSQMGWRDAKIARHLGMEAEEVLRLQQQAGVAEYYKARQYSRSWEWVPDASDTEEDLQDEPAAE